MFVSWRRRLKTLDALNCCILPLEELIAARPAVWLGICPLLTDTIASSIWTVPAGLTQGLTSVAGTKVVIWLSGGKIDQTHYVQNRITTVGGRTMDQTVPLSIKAK